MCVCYNSPKEPAVTTRGQHRWISKHTDNPHYHSTTKHIIRLQSNLIETCSYPFHTGRVTEKTVDHSSGQR